MDRFLFGGALQGNPCVYKNQGFTRHEIWLQIHGPASSENSAEADLFKLLMHDLSTGHILRQHRETDYYGNFLKSPSRKRGIPTQKLTSAFDDEKGYELTELGKQFVFYTMDEVVARLGS